MTNLFLLATFTVGRIIFTAILLIILGIIYSITKGSTKEKDNQEEELKLHALKMLSDEVGVCVPLLKLRLGMPLTEKYSAETAADAKKDFFHCQPFSEKKLQALLKWIELEKDLNNIPALYEAAAEYHKCLENIVIKKWDKMVRKQSSGVIDYAKLKLLYTKAREGSDPELEILKKLYDIYYKVESY